jgi:hypothetical protein
VFDQHEARVIVPEDQLSLLSQRGQISASPLSLRLEKDVRSEVNPNEVQEGGTRSTETGDTPSEGAVTEPAEVIETPEEEP